MCIRDSYFMLTNVGEDYTYSHSFLVKLIGFVSSLCVLVLLLDIAIIICNSVETCAVERCVPPVVDVVLE